MLGSPIAHSLSPVLHRAAYAAMGLDWTYDAIEVTADFDFWKYVVDALTRAEIPVEIVGLKGLLALPEISEVVATLTLVQDVTANASLLTLLAGPRWAIGPRDLALLGRRARELVTDLDEALPPPQPGGSRSRCTRPARSRPR